jgi:plasmid stabilization system protein ParE
MMAAIDRIAEEAHMLSYLETANDFGALAARTLVAEAAKKIASLGYAPASGSRVDDRATLTYMREILVELARPETSAG